jgi:methylated-DNA-[protein]-cysteine S-methyltransferase
MNTLYTHFDSPIGPLLLTSDGASLTGLYMNAGKHSPLTEADWKQDDEALPFPAVKEQLAAYFNGGLREFELPVSLHGTPFQQKVWEELRRIPFGETISYGELARRIGNPDASRAVGLANGKNPVSIIVPCHRVIGANGKLTGYGGGLDNKATLLTLERGGSLLPDEVSSP